MKIPQSIGLFNNDVSIWENAREYYKRRGVYLVIAEGHVIVGADGIVGRFADDASASEALTKAGYTRDPVTQNLIFHP